MRIAGIIAEYNPFHNGHAYQIAQTRAAGATHIAVAMSGSFVQRGEPAICSKFARAQAALRGGADLVVELPAVHALASAGVFARAGVWLLSRLGVDMLSFGSEEGDLARLEQALDLAEQAEGSEEMSRFLKEGMSHPRARAAAVETLFGPEWSERLAGANNLLGMEYLRAIRKLQLPIRPFTVRRMGAAHDSQSAFGEFAGASYLRALMLAGKTGEVFEYLPPAAREILQQEMRMGRAPVDWHRVECLALWKLRQMTAAEFARLPDVSEGLEHRLARAAAPAGSLEEFYQAAKTKRYTLARIRRIAWCAALDITREQQQKLPSCVRVLAMNRRGGEILSRVKAQSGLAVGERFAQLYEKHPDLLAAEVRATELQALAMPQIPPAGMDFTHKLVLDQEK